MATVCSHIANFDRIVSIIGERGECRRVFGAGGNRKEGTSLLEKLCREPVVFIDVLPTPVRLFS